MKASNPLVMVQAYRLLAEEMYLKGWGLPAPPGSDRGAALMLRTSGWGTRLLPCSPSCSVTAGHAERRQDTHALLCQMSKAEAERWCRRGRARTAA